MTLSTFLTWEGIGMVMTRFIKQRCLQHKNTNPCITAVAKCEHLMSRESILLVGVDEAPVVVGVELTVGVLCALLLADVHRGHHLRPKVRAMKLDVFVGQLSPACQQK